MIRRLGCLRFWEATAQPLWQSPCDQCRTGSPKACKRPQFAARRPSPGRSSACRGLGPLPDNDAGCWRRCWARRPEYRLPFAGSAVRRSADCVSTAWSWCAEGSSQTRIRRSSCVSAAHSHRGGTRRRGLGVKGRSRPWCSSSGRGGGRGALPRQSGTNQLAAAGGKPAAGRTAAAPAMLTESEVVWQAAENGILQPVVGTRSGKGARPGGRPRPTNSSKLRGPASASVAADSTTAGAVILDTLDRARLDAIAADAPKQPRGARGGGSGRPAPQRSASGGLGSGGGGDDTPRQHRGRDSHSGPLPPPRASAGGHGHSHSGPQPRVSSREGGHSGPQPGPPPPLSRPLTGGSGHEQRSHHPPHHGGDPHVGTTLGLDMKALAQMERAVGLRGSGGGGVDSGERSGEARAGPLGRELRRPPSGISGGGRSAHAKVMMWDDATADASGAPSGVAPLPAHLLPLTSGTASAAADTTGGYRQTYDILSPGSGGAEDSGRQSRSQSQRMRLAALTADNLAAMEPRRRTDPRERVLRWLEDIEQAETSDPDWQRRRTSSGAQAPKPTTAAAAAAAGGSSTTAPRRTSTATRRTAREADSRPAGFSLSSLFGCFGKGRTRD